MIHTVLKSFSRNLSISTCPVCPPSILTHSLPSKCNIGSSVGTGTCVGTNLDDGPSTIIDRRNIVTITRHCWYNTLTKPTPVVEWKRCFGWPNLALPHYDTKQKNDITTHHTLLCWLIHFLNTTQNQTTATDSLQKAIEACDVACHIKQGVTHRTFQYFKKVLARSLRLLQPPTTTAIPSIHNSKHLRLITNNGWCLLEISLIMANMRLVWYVSTRISRLINLWLMCSQT